MTPIPPLICPHQLSGDYNGEILQFHVYLPFDGDLIFDATDSNFNIINLQGFHDNAGNLGTELGTDGGIEDGDFDTNDDILRLNDLETGNYIFIIEGSNGTIGIFNVSINCNSNSPSSVPTLSPTNNPTPTPTNPRQLTCPDQLTGDYNGGILQFYVHFPFDGDLIFDVTASNFNIINLQGFENNAGNLGNELATDGGVEDGDFDANDDILRINNIPSDDYIFIIEGSNGEIGIFAVSITCYSNSPTSVPTLSPTNNPTPSPTDPPLLICPAQLTGDYNGGVLQFPVQLPIDGDIIFDASNSDFNIINLQGFTNDAGNLGIELGTDGGVEDSDFNMMDDILRLNHLSSGFYIFIIESNPGIIGTFDVNVNCETNMPTNSPITTNPTPSPSVSPSVPTTNPTNIPTIDPITDPTTTPSSDPSLPPSISPITLNPTTTNPTTSEPTITPTTTSPTSYPSVIPTNNPTTALSNDPTINPTELPSVSPITSTSVPLITTTTPSAQPASLPTDPILFPSIPPSISPTSFPTQSPTNNPSFAPSINPTPTPTDKPSSKPIKNLPDCLLQSKCLEVEINEQGIDIYTVCIYWQRNDDCNRRKGKIANICSNDENICKWKRGESNKICQTDIPCGHDAQFYIHDGKGCKSSDDWYGDISNKYEAICMYTGYECRHWAACTWIIFTPHCLSQGSSVEVSDDDIVTMDAAHTEHIEHTKSKQKKKSTHRYRRWI